MKCKHAAILLVALVRLMFPLSIFGDEASDSETIDESVQMIDASGEWFYYIYDGNASLGGLVDYDKGGDIVIPSTLDGYTVKGIAEFNISGRNVTSITIPEGVTDIYDGAFVGDGAWVGGYPYPRDGEHMWNYIDQSEVNRYLEPASLATLPEPRSDGALTLSVAIPESMTSIGKYLFYDLPVADFLVSPGNQTYADIDGVLYDKEGKTLVSYPTSRDGAYDIPEGVTSIGCRAFMLSERLTGVSIPSSVESIGEEAFMACNRLTSVTLPPSIKSIGNGAFSYCTFLNDIYIPDSVASIGDGVFYLSTHLNTITIPNSVKSIGVSVFGCCTRLTDVRIPDSITSIGDWAFAGSGLETLVIPDSVERLGDSAFAESSLTSIIIPSNVKSIGNNLFAYCGSLTDVSISDGITSISEGMFTSCSELTNVMIPNSVTYIGDSAFAWCTDLTGVTIPENVVDIGEKAFIGCEKLTLRVKSGSYAEQYAKDNGIHYVYMK